MTADAEAVRGVGQGEEGAFLGSSGVAGEASNLAAFELETGIDQVWGDELFGISAVGLGVGNEHGMVAREATAFGASIGHTDVGGADAVVASEAGAGIG